MATERHILIVEDNRLYAELMALLLEKEGFEASVVTTLWEAQWYLKTRRFDAVTLDLNLPDSTGNETLQAVHAASPDLPIVVLAGSVGEADYRTLVKLGADACIAKPPDVRHVVQQVERAMRLRNEHTCLEQLQECTKLLAYA